MRGRWSVVAGAAVTLCAALTVSAASSSKEIGGGGPFPDAAVTARFNALYQKRYQNDPIGVIRELAESPDRSATEFLGIILLEPDPALEALASAAGIRDQGRGLHGDYQSDAARALGKRLQPPMSDLRALELLSLGLQYSEVFARETVLLELCDFSNSQPSPVDAREIPLTIKQALPVLESSVLSGFKDADPHVRSTAKLLDDSLSRWRQMDARFRSTERQNSFSQLRLLLGITIGVAVIVLSFTR